MSIENTLFIVEDNNADYRVLKRILKKLDNTTPTHRAATGEEALQQLREGVTHGDDAYKLSGPKVILLDLNLPGTDGREILEKLKQDQKLSQIPVVIFTTSTSPSDINFCYENGANGYMVKPVDMESLTDKIQKFIDYWLGTNIAPTFVMQ